MTKLLKSSSCSIFFRTPKPSLQVSIKLLANSGPGILSYIINKTLIILSMQDNNLERKIKPFCWWHWCWFPPLKATESGALLYTFDNLIEQNHTVNQRDFSLFNRLAWTLQRSEHLREVKSSLLPPDSLPITQNKKEKQKTSSISLMSNQEFRWHEAR